MITKGIRLKVQEVERAQWARSFLSDAVSEADVYRAIFLRGLELVEAEALAVDFEPPPVSKSGLVITRATTRMLLLIPMLAKAGLLPTLAVAGAGVTVLTGDQDDAGASAVEELGSEFV